MRNLLLLFFLIPFIIWGQKAHFRAFSTVDGLPQSQVLSISQDTMGYLWVGTMGGVARFNGGEFESYTISNGLYNNRVSCIKAIGNRVFVGHEGGLSYKVNDQFKSVELPFSKERSPVTAIVEYKGKLIISTNGSGLYELKKGALVKWKIGAQSEFIRSMVVVGNKLLLATYDEIIETQDLITFEQIYRVEDLNIIDLFYRGNQLLIGTYLNGLISFSLKDKVGHKLSNSEGYRINKVVQDEQGNLLIATSVGLLEMEDNQFILKTTHNGLPVNNLSTLFTDRDNNIWIGTNGKGLILAPNQHVRYFDKQAGLPTDIVISILQKKNREYVFGSIDSYIHSTYDFVHFRSKKVETPPWVMTDDVNERFWYRSEKGVSGINDEGKEIELDQAAGVLGGRVTALYRIDKNKMYIGSSHGVVLYKNGQIFKLVNDNEQLENVRAVFPMSNYLLIGTDNGLYKLKNRKYVKVSTLNTIVFSITQLKNGRVFIGTEEGVYEFSKDELTRIDYASKIASNYINFLISKGNDLIAGTNNGVLIFRFEGVDFQTIHLTKNHGLIDLETNINSAFFDVYNKLWFGTPSGLVRLDYEKFVTAKQSVNLVYKNSLLNYKSFPIAEFEGVWKNGYPDCLVFPHNKNNLQFQFDVIALKDYDNLSLQYWLEGLEGGWTPLTKSSSVSYSGLQSGEYTLKIRIINDDGVVLLKKSIHFFILQAFYKTWWFILLISCLFIFLVFISIRYKLRRENIRAELEKAEMRTRLVQLEQQSLNASMNRHFIFNALNSIQYFINISDKLSANKYLSSFAKLIRKNLDSSAEDDNMVTLEQEIERLELYLSLEAMRFNGLFDYKIHCDVKDIEIKIPAMMVQPFVENSIIHGVLACRDKKGLIEIEFIQDNDDLVILVRDNGIGIDKSFENKSKSIGDHRSRGMEITMTRIDLIRKISDKNLSIEGPYQLISENGDIQGTEVKLKINIILLDN